MIEIELTSFNGTPFPRQNSSNQHVHLLVLDPLLLYRYGFLHLNNSYSFPVSSILFFV